MDDSILASLTQLEELVLNNNKLKTMPKISHLTNLVNFQIASNEISKITPLTFKNLTKLKYIDLSRNKIVDSSVILNINTPLKDSKLLINLALNRLQDLDLKNLNRQQQIYVVYGNPFDCSKWDQMNKLRGKSKDGCEEKFVFSGRVPFCINYRAGSYAFFSLYENDIDRLIDAVKTQEKTFECSVKPNMEHLLNFVSLGCVA